MFSVALAGNIQEPSETSRQLLELIGHMKSCANPDSDRMELMLVVSPLLVSGDWAAWIKRSGCAVTGCLREEDAAYAEVFGRKVAAGGSRRELICETVLDRADILLAVWNETLSEPDGAVWDLMQKALAKRIPCIWVSSKTGKIYWQDRTVYDTYTPQRVNDYISLYRQARTEPAAKEGKDLPFLSAAGKLYDRFLRKYKARARIIDAKEDVLLQDDYRIGDTIPGAEGIRRKLLAHFRCFDHAAIEANQRYQSVLYWRAILPFITNLFLAVGFYADPVLAAVPWSSWPSMKVWSIIAGCGFLIHGLLNLYVYLLSKSRRVREYRNEMVRNRQMAEMLRVMIHFVPFGIHPDLRKLCGDHQELYVSLRRIVWEAEPDDGYQELSETNAKEAFRHAEEMLSDQIAYHAQSVDRYDSLVKHLERWNRTIFLIGFAAVILRAFYQFFIVIPEVPDLYLGNGITVAKFSKSFANMVALLVPAWAAYFSSKLSLCNFGYNRDNHKRMLDLLQNEQDNFAHLQERIGTVPGEILRVYGESIAEMMVEKDVSPWTEKYERTKIDHL